MSDTGKFVLVGHCGPDMYMLRTAVERAVPGTAIETVNDAASLSVVLSKGAVLLVNRVLDGDFAGEGGIELIREVSRGDSAPICLLISNFDDAQEDAVAAGAKPGFGKDDLYEEETARKLREALGV